MGSKYPGSGNAARPSSLWNRLLHFVPALWVTVETACRKLLQISRAALRLGRTANQPREPGTMEKLKPANLVVSQSGIDFIKRWEGFRRHIYDDGYGNPTIGYGHLVDDDRLVNVTREQAEALLLSDCMDVLRELRKHVQVTLKQQQVDALVSLYLNVGVLWMTEGSVIRKINAGQYTAAAATILQYNKANGKTSIGLTRRRHAERRLFLEGTY